MRKSRELVAAFLVFLFISPAIAEDSLKEQIQTREDEWAAAYNANDASALGLFYEEDAVLITPGSVPAYGRAAIEEALAGLFPLLKNGALIVDSVRPMGEAYAVEVGHSTYMAIGESGEETPGSDNYVVVWHKGDDGVWRYTTDIFNARIVDE